MRQLPEVQRIAVVLHHLCDLSVEQVASETGAPTGTVKARLARGRAALAGHLGRRRTAVSDGHDLTTALREVADAHRTPPRIPGSEIRRRAAWRRRRRHGALA